MYFFGNDFPGQPPYSAFVEGYSEIGAKDEAAALAAAVDLFPFPEPHKHLDLRREFLNRYPDEGPFLPYTDALCGNERVFVLLEYYVEKHAADFSISTP
jgi:hypothetical protein